MAGDVYAPHDLSSVEMQKWRRPVRPGDELRYKGKRREWGDTFDALAIEPVKEYKVRGFGIFWLGVGRIGMRVEADVDDGRIIR